MTYSLTIFSFPGHDKYRSRGRDGHHWFGFHFLHLQEKYHPNFSFDGNGTSGVPSGQLRQCREALHDTATARPAQREHLVVALVDPLSAEEFGQVSDFFGLNPLVGIGC